MCTPIPENGMTCRSTLFLLLSILTISVQAQDIFSHEARVKFANSLSSKGRFSESAQEWKTIDNQFGSDSSLKMTIQAFRRANLPDSVLSILDVKRPQSKSDSMLFESERYYAYAMTGRLKRNDRSYGEHQDSAILVFCSLIISGQIKDVKQMLKEEKLQIELSKNGSTELALLVHEVSHLKKHSKWGLTAASAVVPGSGKIILGRITDGALAFSVVATNTVMGVFAYREFGARSAWPWLYATIGTGFYVSNIYGTYHAAKDEYPFRLNELKKHAKSYLHRYLFNR